MATISHRTRKVSAELQAVDARKVKAGGILPRGALRASVNACGYDSGKELSNSSDRVVMKRQPKDDPVSPKHYRAGKIEPIDVIEDWRLGFHLGNTVKYIARAEHKGSKLTDLRKAHWYLDRYIQHLEKENNGDGKTI